MTELTTPVVLIIFNRPQPTQQVIDALRCVEPRRLLIIADGPRADKPTDAELCAQTRQVVETIDWTCEVEKNYSDVNLGCGKRVSSGLDWVFEQHETAIILEDDCVPDPTFFTYCTELLHRYHDDDRIMHISGNNMGANHSSIHPFSYGFTLFAQVWGWATWRRAWSKFDPSISSFSEFIDQGLLQSINVSSKRQKRLAENWRSVFGGSRDIWDYQWHYAIMSNSSLAISPTVNLVSNIGFGVDATHTLNDWKNVSNLRTEPISSPLEHPIIIRNDPRIDDIYAAKMLDRSLLHRLKYGTIRRLRRL